jgi:hypothetical protein
LHCCQTVVTNAAECPDDLEVLVDALVEAVRNPDERRDRGENAYRQVESGATRGIRRPERFVAVYEAVTS